MKARGARGKIQRIPGKGFGESSSTRITQDTEVFLGYFVECLSGSISSWLGSSYGFWRIIPKR